MTSLPRVDAAPRPDAPPGTPRRGDFSAALKEPGRHGDERKAPHHQADDRAASADGRRSSGAGASPEERRREAEPLGKEDLALPVLGGGCVVESARLFGEHLTAGGLLSLLSLADTAPAGASPGRLSAAAAATASIGAADNLSSRPGGDACLPSPVANGPMPGGAVGAPRSPHQAGESDTDICRRVAACAGLPDAERWADRAMRLVRSSSGDAVLWLRDYRATSDRLHPVIQALVAQAPELKLHKIMFNGRRIWTSGATQGSDDGH